MYLCDDFTCFILQDDIAFHHFLIKFLLIWIECRKPRNRTFESIWVCGASTKPFAFLIYSVSLLSRIPLPSLRSRLNTASPANVSANSVNATP